jgi:FixJ family two-component response regulator
MLKQRESTVFIVDDDELMRSLIQSLVQSAQLPAEVYGGAQEFLAGHDTARPGCLVTDVRMPGMSGMELQERLAAQQSPLPVILVTAHADVPMVVQAMKSNVVDVIEKPFDHDDLLARIQKAVRLDAERRHDRACREALAARIASLSPREREIMDLVVLGFANKRIARHLKLSEKTVEAHRSHLMRKLGAQNLAELVRMGVAADPENLLGLTAAPLGKRA